MGRHKSTSAAGTAKEKKAERRCKRRPRGAEPLKAQISSLIYKRTGNLINKATLGMLHLRLESRAPALLSVWGMRQRVPATSRAGSCLLFVTWPGTAHAKTSTPRGICCTDTALIQLFLDSCQLKGVGGRGFGVFFCSVVWLIFNALFP